MADEKARKNFLGQFAQDDTPIWRPVSDEQETYADELANRFLNSREKARDKNREDMNRLGDMMDICPRCGERFFRVDRHLCLELNDDADIDTLLRIENAQKKRDELRMSQKMICTCDYCGRTKTAAIFGCYCSHRPKNMCGECHHKI